MGLKQETYRIRAQGISRQHIWQLWSDINNSLIGKPLV